MVISIIDGLFDQDELDLILSALFEGFLRAIPENLESLKEEEYAAYILPALIRSPKISDTFSGKDFTQLLQIEGLPEFLLGFIENYERVLKQSLEAIQLIKTHILAYPAKLPKQSNKPVNP